MTQECWHEMHPHTFLLALVTILYVWSVRRGRGIHSFDSERISQFFNVSTGSLPPQNVELSGQLAQDEANLYSFNISGIETFLDIFWNVSRPHARGLVVMCNPHRDLCGGISDRSRGLPYALSLAILTGRQLKIHSSILTNELISDGILNQKHYRFVDGNCDHPGLLSKLVDDPSEEIFVTSNCHQSVPKQKALPEGIVFDSLVLTIEQQCEITHRCGAAIIHHSPVFHVDLARAQRLAANLDMLPVRNYTVLHVRAGGSKLTVDNATVEAIPWKDGYASGIAQAWIDAFRAEPFRQCQFAVAVISDSQRVISELRLAASENLMLTHCCNQPLHRDRHFIAQFPLQEIIDLYILARSSLIIATQGGFAVLGRYWLGGPGPRFTLANTPDEIDHAKSDLMREAACEPER